MLLPMSLWAENYTWNQLEQIRDSYETRREEAFALLKGKKLVREKVIPPIFSDGSDFSRHYSYSLIDYAFKCFWLGEDIKGANAALLENANYYINYPRAYSDKDSFYWAADELCKILEFYGSNGTKKKGLIKKNVEERILLMMWQYSKQQSKVAKADYKIHGMWMNRRTIMYSASMQHGILQNFLWHILNMPERNMTMAIRWNSIMRHGTVI